MNTDPKSLGALDTMLAQQKAHIDAANPNPSAQPAHDVPPYYMSDVTKKDGDTLAKMASHPDFFYVYINSGGQDSAKAGQKYAGLCDLLLQHRRSDQPLPEGSSLTSVVGQGMRGMIYGAIARAASLKSGVAKGLYDADDRLVGATVLLNGRDNRTEIGYFLHPDLHGKGLATTMVMSALQWARDNPAASGLSPVLFGDVDPANRPSLGILNKLGMQENKERFRAVGKYEDRDGKPIPSMILEADTAGTVNGVVNAYAARSGTFFPVKDIVMEENAAKLQGAPVRANAKPTSKAFSDFKR